MGPDMDNSKFSILLVDDEEDIVEFLSYNLKKECHSCSELSKTKLNNFDAIEMVFDKIHELIDDAGIVIDDLTC